MDLDIVVRFPQLDIPRYKGERPTNVTSHHAVYCDLFVGGRRVGSTVFPFAPDAGDVAAAFAHGMGGTLAVQDRYPHAPGVFCADGCGASAPVAVGVAS